MTNDLSQQREHILRAINAERDVKGLPRLKLGTNGAAQAHADDMCANVFSSHWGSDGTTPAVRYTLHGGRHFSQQWVTGQNFRSTNTGRAPESKIDAAIQPLLEPKTGNSVALDERFDSVNIGIAASGSDLWLALQFATDYIQFDVPPVIDIGYLQFHARTTDFADFSPKSQLARVNYLPPPHRLARGQLVLSTGNDQGRPIMSIMKPDAQARRYKEGDYITEQAVGINPYDIDPDFAIPDSPREVAHLTKELRSRASGIKEAWKVPQRNANVRIADDGTLRASIWFGDALDTFGNGIYSVTIWGVNATEQQIPMCNYAVFVPPRALVGS